MRHPSRPVSIALLAFSPAVIACCDEPSVGDVDVGTISASQLWGRVVARNKVWLDPTAEDLTYIASSRPIEDDNRFPEIINRVWVSNGKARWEMDGAKAGVNGTEMSYVLVVRGENEQYLKAPLQDMVGKPRKARDIRTMIQGVAWTSAVHVLAQTGLPKQSSIVERRTVAGGQLVVLEADLGTARRHIGVGLYHSYYGSSSGWLGRVRIYVKTPEFIPVKEEYPAGEIPASEVYPEGKKYPARDIVIEYDQPFMTIGKQVAPRTIRHISKSATAKGDWILEAHFQQVNGKWLLEKAYNIQGGRRKFQMVLSGVSTKPVDRELFEITPAR